MIEELNQTVVQCTRCPRLVRWREMSAQNPPVDIWEKSIGQALPDFGDGKTQAVVGPAPVAHGRIAPGEWLRETAMTSMTSGFVATVAALSK